MPRLPLFLTLEQVEAIHVRSLVEHGGAGGIRDAGGLESAVMQPQNVHYYLGGDLFNIAAAYAFHIAEAQAYLDGNKRTAIASALIFLEINGIETTGNRPDGALPADDRRVGGQARPRRLDRTDARPLRMKVASFFSRPWLLPLAA